MRSSSVPSRDWVKLWRMIARQSQNGCLCGSTESYADCCGRYLSGKCTAPTAEALMRSRYSAYALGNAAYLRDTWHPSTRPQRLDLAGPRWTGLTVTATKCGGPDDAIGEVVFVARYDLDGIPGELRERSRFRREAGRWFYLDGGVAQERPARNSPCPCGSGRKFKRCCGMR